MGIEVVWGVVEDMEDSEETPEGGVLMDMEDLWIILHAMPLGFVAIRSKTAPTDDSISRWK